MVHLIELGIRPRQIMTKDAFENAIAITMALGGSTNAVLHLLAIAHEARVELELDDFNRVGARVPHIADMKPHGKYHMVDLDRVGGVAVVMRELLDAGCSTATASPSPARPWPRTSPSSTRPKPDGEVVHPLADPIHAQGGIAVLRGSLAPNGGVVKVAGIDDLRFDGTARVLRRRGRSRWKRSSRARSTRGDVVVIRYEGPKGGPGMREMLAVTGAMKGVGRGADAALVTDGRFSGRHARILRRARRARSCRRRADRARCRGRSHRDRRRRTHHRPPRRRRRARTSPQHWKPMEPRYTMRFLAKYAKLAQGAETGAITNF